MMRTGNPRHERAELSDAVRFPAHWGSWLLGVILIAGSYAAVPAGRAADTAEQAVRAAADSRGLLRLQRGDFLGGQLVNHADPEQIAWQHPAFDAEFVFPLRSLTGAAFAPPATPRYAEGEFCAELTNGDRWFGSLTAVSETSVQFRSPAYGELTIRREMLRRLFRWRDGQVVIYSGPGALESWQSSGDETAWTDAGGQLRTDRAFASVYGDLNLPAQSQIELEVSWEEQPNFTIALGVSEDPASDEQAYRVEIWNGTFVLLRELDESAVIAELGSVAAAEGQLRLTFELDQIAGRAVAYSAHGSKLAEIELREPPASGAASGEDRQPSSPGIRLINIHGSVRLDSLRVVAQQGRVLTAAPAAETRIHLADGRSIDGRISSAGEDSWVVTDGEQEHLIEPDEVLAAHFAAGNQASGVRADSRGVTTRVGVATHSGIQATGMLERIAGQVLHLRPEGVEQTVPLKVPDLRSLTVRGDLPIAASPAVAGEEDLPKDHLPDWYTIDLPEPAPAGSSGDASRIGRLELEDARAPTPQSATRLHGRLVEAEASDETTALRFHPLDAVHPAGIRSDASGRLVYRDRPPEPPPVEKRGTRTPQPRPGILGAFANVFGGDGTSQAATPQTGGQTLYLRSGDVLPCTIERIDADAVMFTSPVVGATRVPHDSIRAVKMVNVEVDAIDPSKRERLLTVPRMRKNTPPTHLIASLDGDYLRGRLQHVDDQTLAFESRLETLEIPRRVVARIIWFHGDELDASDPPDAPPGKASDERGSAEEAGGTAEAPPVPTAAKLAEAETAESGEAPALQVQAVQRNGVRLTFRPQAAGGGELIGESPLLGVCLVNLSRVDELLIGDRIQAAIVESPFYDWRLSHAPEPKVLQQEDGSAPAMRNAGIDSPLVGTAAPEFELDLLTGESFRLADQRGKIVVLDFWATWCGPCIQAMPQVEEAVAAFPADQVRLVAVNLQEPEEQIRSMLERLQLDPAVALDIDGVVAARYQANAIPQTVVIDRSGTITRLFVGGGPTLGDQLQQAIQQAIDAEAP